MWEGTVERQPFKNSHLKIRICAPTITLIHYITLNYLKVLWASILSSVKVIIVIAVLNTKNHFCAVNATKLFPPATCSENIFIYNYVTLCALELPFNKLFTLKIMIKILTFQF